MCEFTFQQQKQKRTADGRWAMAHHYPSAIDHHPPSESTARVGITIGVSRTHKHILLVGLVRIACVSRTGPKLEGGIPSLTPLYSGNYRLEVSYFQLDSIKFHSIRCSTLCYCSARISSLTTTPPTIAHHYPSAVLTFHRAAKTKV